jgi:hypothetical protein
MRGDMPDVVVTHLIIGGKWSPALGESRYDICNPARPDELVGSPAMAARNFAHVTLELDGNDPGMVLEDASSTRRRFSAWSSPRPTCPPARSAWRSSVCTCMSRATTTRQRVHSRDGALRGGRRPRPARDDGPGQQPAPPRSHARDDRRGALAQDFRAPFGGFKQSGIGRNLGYEGVLEFQEYHSISAPAGWLL